MFSGDANNMVRAEKEHIMDEALLHAYALQAVLGHKEDDLSEREAFDLYGSGWVRDRTKRKLLKVERNGSTSRSTKMYSRFEIESLKRAEKGLTERFNSAMSRMKELETQNTRKK